MKCCRCALVSIRIRINVLLCVCPRYSTMTLDRIRRDLQRVLVDLRVAYAGARADADRTKVFKLDAGELGAGEVMTFRKRLSLRQMTTRTHHPGTHRVEALVNGAAFEVGTFEVTR